MLVILLATFITLKIKTPDLPVLSGDEERNHNRFTLIGIIFCSVAIFWVALHVFFSYFIALRKIEIFLIHQNIAAIVNSVIVPSYFINTLPNLKKYFNDCLKDYIANPMCNALDNVLNYLKSFLPSPRVHVVDE